MIFAAEGHIEMIRNGGLALRGTYVLHPGAIIKTQTRRVNRGYYKLEAERKKPHKTGYAVQRKRGVKGEPDIRIIFDNIWEESTAEFHREDSTVYPIPISKEDAWAEGGYNPEEYEEVFLKLNPKGNRFSRWAFEFHCVEVRKNVLGITSNAREERVERTFYPEHEG